MSDEQTAEPDPATEFTADPDTRRLIYDELRHRHDVQRAVSDRLEGKAALVLGAALGLLQFVAREPVDSWWLPPAIAAYALSGLAALAIVLPRRFDELGPEQVLRQVWWWKLSDAASYISNGRLIVIKRNVRHQAFKVRWLRASIGLLLAGAIMSAVHLTQGERDEQRTGAPGGDSTAVIGRAADARVDAGS